MLCHIKNLQNPEAFLERLVRAGCGGVLLELHLDTDAPRQCIHIQKLCHKLNLQYWLMPVVDHPAQKHHAWILETGNGAPQPKPQPDTLDVLQANSADYLFRQLKKYFHQPPDGVFLPTPFAASKQAFPWSSNVEKYFSTQHSYQLRDKWHCLTSTIGADDAMVRQHYWQTVNSMMEEFLHRCKEICQELKSTFRHQITAPELAALQLPGEAMLRHRASHSIEIIAFTNWPELVRETFSCYFHTAQQLAVTLPSNFEVEPARQYFALAKTVGQLFAKGQNCAKVGLLFPLRSARTHYHPDSHRYPRWVGEDFARMIDYLNAMHYDYHLVAETELINPPCELLIVPSITALASASWDAIQAWIKRGGKVACTGLLPRWSERGRDGELEERISRATKQVLQDVYDGYLAWEQGTALPPHIGFPIYGEDISGGRLCSYTPRLNHDGEDARLRLSQIMRESLQSDFSSQNTAVHYQHRKEPDVELFYLFNNSDVPQQLISRWMPLESPTRQISEYRLSDGQRVPTLVWAQFPEEQGGGVNLTLSFAPYQLRVFELSSNGEQWHLWRANFSVDSLDSDVIKGHAAESVPPFCIREQALKNQQWTAPKVLLPAPLRIEEDSMQQDGNSFSGELFVPAEWRAHRIFLEMRLEQSAAQAHLNRQYCGIVLSAPPIIDVTEHVRCGEMNLLQLQFWPSETAATMAPARLVALPEIEIPIKM